MLGLIYDRRFLQHDTGEDHPECPQRLEAILRAIEKAGWNLTLVRIPFRQASAAELAQVHEPAYVDLVRMMCDAGFNFVGSRETRVCPGSYDIAALAAGGVLAACDWAMGGSGRRVFCAVRPPGHHAEADQAMGFCLFNNVAVGAAHALAHHRLRRVAIVDFDVHHGNGTEDMFHDDPRVLFCSTFQHPYYPYCGADSGNDHVINVPLPAMTGSEGFRAAVERHWMPALERFEPQLVFISAGFDAHREDPLAYLQLEDEDYGWVTRRIVEVAERHAGGRIVSTLEGGYNTASLARSALQHVRMLGA